MKNLIFGTLVALSFPMSASSAEWFGYFHVSHNDLTRNGIPDIKEVMGHTNMLIIQTANPNQDFHTLLREHPSAPFILEFHIQSQEWRGVKLYSYDPNRSKQILDAVEALIRPYKNRAYAFYIIDEIENNPTDSAVEQVIKDIRSRSAFNGIKIWVDYDNLNAKGYPVRILEGTDLISLTPAYARDCLDCEKNRYTLLLETASAYNQAHPGNKVELIVIGDGWASRPVNENIQINKAEPNYYTFRELARQQGITTVGEAVFSYSEPENYTVGFKNGLKAEWERIGKLFVNNQLSPGEPGESGGPKENGPNPQTPGWTCYKIDPTPSSKGSRHF